MTTRRLIPRIGCIALAAVLWGSGVAEAAPATGNGTQVATPARVSPGPPEEPPRAPPAATALASDLHALRAQLMAGDASLRQIRAQIDEVRAPGGDDAIVGLVAALTASLGGGWVYRQRGRQRLHTPDGPDDTLALSGRARPFESLAIELDANPPTPKLTPAARDEEAAEPATLPQDAPDEADGFDARLIKVVEVDDAQLQAEFFIALGESHHAVDALERHLNEAPDVGPAVSLDLLHLYRQLHRTDAFESLRRDVEARFNIRVPAFDSDPGARLHTAPAVPRETVEHVEPVEPGDARHGAGERGAMHAAPDGPSVSAEAVRATEGCEQAAHGDTSRDDFEAFRLEDMERYLDSQRSALGPL